MPSFVLEPAVINVFPEVGIYGPFVALPLGVQDIPASALGFEEFDLLAPGLATLAMLAWIRACFAPAAVLLRRRDVE